MSDSPSYDTDPELRPQFPEQSARVCPSNAFIKFKIEWIERSIPDHFRRQVNKSPGRTAVKTENYSLSYRALEAMANRIAWTILSRRGRGAESVALLLDHDAPMIAAILGVLKAGKIYVPLDPWHPPSRTAYVLEDAQVQLIVTDTNNLNLFDHTARRGCPVLNIDEIDVDIPAQSPDLPLPADTLAYIFYTSGSTGRPKGVMDNHRNVLHNIMRYTNSLHICEEDRLTLLQSCSFSGSVSSIFSALLNGATLLPFNLHKHGVEGLVDWLIREEITIYHSVPMIFRRFLMGELKFETLRVIRLEGDQASKEDVELYKKHFSSECTLVNGLGATETGITRQFFIDRQTRLTGGTVPVGYPVKDMEVLLLDEAGKEVEAGSVGEIAVKSKYLAPGYWRRQDLTQASFMRDPEDAQKRIYRTGDMGRMRADSCLEHLGRKDFQLKISGQWVEAAEVERALIAAAPVKEALVITREDKAGEPKLIAYLVVRSGKRAPAVSSLRRALSETLPAYMIPSSFIFLNALPLNPNGKVDRFALPTPDEVSSRSRGKPVAPRTPVERALAEFWCEVLELEEVSIHDDFFELEGDSLRAMQVISRVRHTFGLELPIRIIFESPTLASLALVLEERIAEEISADERVGNLRNNPPALP